MFTAQVHLRSPSSLLTNSNSYLFFVLVICVTPAMMWLMRQHFILFHDHSYVLHREKKSSHVAFLAITVFFVFVLFFFNMSLNQCL